MRRCLKDAVINRISHPVFITVRRGRWNNGYSMQQVISALATAGLERCAGPVQQFHIVDIPFAHSQIISFAAVDRQPLHWL